MADTMKMEYKIFLEAEDVSQSRILSCASYMKRVLESCNNPYISRAELDDESDLDDFAFSWRRRSRRRSAPTRRWRRALSRIWRSL